MTLLLGVSEFKYHELDWDRVCHSVMACHSLQIALNLVKYCGRGDGIGEQPVWLACCQHDGQLPFLPDENLVLDNNGNKFGVR